MTTKVSKRPDPNDHIGLAYTTADMFLKKNPSLFYLREDLRQEAAEAMVKACACWRPKLSNCSLSTHIIKRCQYQLLDYLKYNEFRALRVLKLEDVIDIKGSSNDEEIDNWEELVEGQVFDMVAALNRLEPELKADAEELIINGFHTCYNDLWHCSYSKAKERRDAICQAIENINELPY